MKRYNVYIPVEGKDNPNQFVTYVDIRQRDEEVNIEDLEPVWDAMPDDHFPNEPDYWFHLAGDERELEIYGFDGNWYAHLEYVGEVEE